MNEGRYDAIVVGSGPVGAHVAKVLGDAGKRVLVLEAGRNSGATWESYQSFLETYYTAVIKEPNSPYPQNASAPSPLATDILRIRKGTPDLVGYQVELGPQAFGSTYLRSLAGTSLHWLGTTPRFVPNDFRMQSEYGVGVDWPITYDDVQPYYCEAEWSMGVAANVEDQAKLGVWFPDGYEYPMERIPPSFSDTIIQRATAKATVRLGDGRTYPVRVSSLAQARNSVPRTHRILVNGRDRNGYTPVGAVGKPEVGVRCEGNASCIPICPVQAKYSALKTLAQCDPRLVTVHTQCIVTKLHIGGDGRITGVDYLTYDVGYRDAPRRPVPLAVRRLPHRRRQLGLGRRDVPARRRCRLPARAQRLRQAAAAVFQRPVSAPGAHWLRHRAAPRREESRDRRAGHRWQYQAGD